MIINQEIETRVDSISKYMTKLTFSYKLEKMPKIIDEFIEHGKLSRLNILAEFLIKKKDKKNIALLIEKCKEAGFNSVEGKIVDSVI